jgi:hypothetical protein
VLDLQRRPVQCRGGRDLQQLHGGNLQSQPRRQRLLLVSRGSLLGGRRVEL